MQIGDEVHMVFHIGSECMAMSDDGGHIITSKHIGKVSAIPPSSRGEFFDDYNPFITVEYVIDNNIVHLSAPESSFVKYIPNCTHVNYYVDYERKICLDCTKAFYTNI